jgi:hypothetical protein
LRRKVNRLMTITGANPTVAAGIVAAIGDIGRFKSPQKLVGYFALNPRVRQSGLGGCSSRSHQQDRPQSRAGHAGRRGLGSSQNTRTAACFFRAHPGQTSAAMAKRERIRAVLYSRLA